MRYQLFLNQLAHRRCFPVFIAMELRQLKYFLAVAANGSFSRVAALCGSTQSAVSKSISALEKEWSVRLFHRTGRGAGLTPAGRALLPKAESLGGLR